MFDFKPEMNWIDSNIDYFAEKSQIHFLCSFLLGEKILYYYFLGSGDSTWPIKNLCDKFTRYTFFRLFNNVLTGWLVFANGNEITYTNRKKIQWEFAMTMCMDWLEIHRKKTQHETNELYMKSLVYRLQMPYIFRCVGFIVIFSEPNCLLELTILKHEMCWSRLKSAWIFPNWAHST